jgi:predicted adenylyl cyclase CyaB
MEVESKVKVASLEKLKQQLIKMGAVFGEQKTQEDQYFYRDDVLDKVKGPGSSIVRIRKSSKCYLTSKTFTNQLGAWEEHEIVIENPEELRKLLIKVGFVPVLDIIKKRQTGRLNEYELCLDDIKDYGTYLEVSLDSDEKETARKKILELLNKLGFKESDIDHRSYAEVMLGNKGEKYQGMK